MKRRTFDGILCEITECLKVVTSHKKRIEDRDKRQKAREDREKANRSLLCRALDTFGAEAQTLMVFEEMSELQKELCKHARGKDNRLEIAEEIADVQIMLEQMAILHDCAREVSCIRLAKLIRLAERLNGGAE